MITVSQEVMDEFLSPAQKNLRLRFSDNTTLNNDDIYTETMNLEQAICTEEQIRFGAVNSACFKVQIKGTAKRYKGLKVTPYIYTKSGGVTLGEFTIVNDELSDNREYRSLTAYDALNEVFEKDLSTWYTRLNLPMSLKNFRNSLFSTLGITQETVTLPNDSMVVERTVSTTDAVLSGKKVLESICEINGCFGAMVYSTTSNRSVFRYVTIKGDDTLYPRNDLYPNDTLYPRQGNVLFANENDILQGGVVYQEFTSLPIKRVQIRNTAHDIGATYPTNITTGNAYQITDNFLLYGKNDTALLDVARNFYGAVDRITYIPSKATMRGRPWQELGDLIVVNIKRTSVTFPVLKRVLSGITALKDEYEAKGRENYTYSINSTRRQLEQVRQKTLEIVTTVDELRTTMTESVNELGGKVESYRSEFQQTAQQIQTTVDAHYNAYTTFQSQITQRANSIETRVTATENGLSSANTAISRTQSSITQTASEIRAELSSATTHAAIVAKINDNTSSVKIKADKVDISGFVTFNDLKTSGSTIISGDNITTGVIRDSSGDNYWDLVNGVFHSNNLVRSIGDRVRYYYTTESGGTSDKYGYRMISISNGNIDLDMANNTDGSTIGLKCGSIGMNFERNTISVYAHGESPQGTITTYRNNSNIGIQADRIDIRNVGRITVHRRVEDMFIFGKNVDLSPDDIYIGRNVQSTGDSIYGGGTAARAHYDGGKYFTKVTLNSAQLEIYSGNSGSPFKIKLTIAESGSNGVFNAVDKKNITIKNASTGENETLMFRKGLLVEASN